MWERNDGTGKDNTTHNQFTAYLVVAVRNRRIQYRRSLAKRQRFVETLDILDFQDIPSQEPEIISSFSVLDQLENLKLQQALANTTQRELFILFARVLEGRSLGDIASEQKPSMITITFYYTKQNQLLTWANPGVTESVHQLFMIFTRF